MIETAARRTATRALWLGVKGTIKGLFTRWVWARRLATDYCILLRRALVHEAVKHRYIGDHCQAERFWRSTERVNRWVSKWGWLDWPQTYPHSWLREAKAKSWAELTSSEPTEYNEIPDVKFQVIEKDLDGKPRTVLREGTLVDMWVEEGVPDSQDGQMVFHVYDGPSLSDRLMGSAENTEGDVVKKRSEDPALSSPW